VRCEVQCSAGSLLIDAAILIVGDRVKL